MGLINWAIRANSEAKAALAIQMELPPSAMGTTAEKAAKFLVDTTMSRNPYAVIHNLHPVAIVVLSLGTGLALSLGKEVAEAVLGKSGICPKREEAESFLQLMQRMAKYEVSEGLTTVDRLAISDAVDYGKGLYLALA